MGFFDKLLAGNVLYYPGCSTKFVAKDVEKKYKEFLNKMGIDFIQLADLEKCCGSPMLNAGYKDDFKKLAEENLKIFKERGISKIITNCPGCYLHFSKIYPEYLGDDWDIEVEYFLVELWNLVEAGKVKLKQKDGSVTYHDPCHIGRAIGIYDIPRKILEASGYELKEMELNKEYSLCCGAGGTANINAEETSKKMADERLRMANETGADMLTSPCVLCTYQFDSHNENKKLNIDEFSLLIDIE